MVAVAGEVIATETEAERGVVTAAAIEIAIEVVTEESTEETEAEIAGELLPLVRDLDWATEVTTAARPVEVASAVIAEIEVGIGAGTEVVTEVEIGGAGPAGTAESVAVVATGMNNDLLPLNSANIFSIFFINSSS